MAKEQRILIYTGSVQGVGFRYTATHLARGFAVDGYVRNLPDGGVELLAEGEDEEITAFTQMLTERFDGYIRDQRVFRHPYSGAFRGFVVER
ncbi:MAG: acylphosphatase [Phycisphaerae bacterium]|nr:acylphosphatase [Phycisphaerae bacterium]